MSTNKITTLSIEDDAVTQAKIAIDAVGNSELLNDAVTQAKIAIDAVGNSELLNDAVTEDKILDDAVTIGKIDFGHDDLDGFLTNEHIDWTANQSSSIHFGNLPALALTTVQTAANQTAHLALTTQEGDVVVRSDENKSYIHNAGTAGTMNDFTLLATPTDSVLSVNGQTGIVTTINTTYSAGSGLDLSGTTFSVEPDLRDGITHVGLGSGDNMGWVNNSHTFFYVNGGERARLVSNGDLHVDGDVIAYSTTISDERLKENIQPIEDALSKVNQLNGCTFTYTADGKESAGLIAQDVEKVLPSAVSEKELPLKIDDGKEYKVLQYDQTIGLLVEAIKELTTKVAILEGK